jgi:hypothetical protein
VPEPREVKSIATPAFAFARDVAKGSLDFFENEYFDSSLRAIPPKIGKFTLLLRKVFTK